MEILKDVLIKESAGVDKVIIIDNLPKSLLYKKDLKMMIDITDPLNHQQLVPAFRVSERGTRIPTGEMIDVLLPGIEKSQSGDDAYVFYTDYNEAVERLAAIDRYIEKVVPQAERIPERVPYAAQKGLMSSPPIARHLIPRVVLPEIVSPRDVESLQSPAPRVISNPPEAPKNRQIMTEEMRQAARERMAKARAAKAAKLSK